MAQYKLLLPKMGESVAEATIIKWTKNPGDNIETDETVIEIATDKVDSEVPSPVSGKLIERFFNENDVVQVGAVIAIIETPDPQAQDLNTGPAPIVETPQPVAEVTAPFADNSSFNGQYNNNNNNNSPGIENNYNWQPTNEVSQPVPFTDQLVQTNTTVGDEKKSFRFYSPLVKSIATQEGISIAELDQIPGNGAEGRLTKDDLLAYIQSRQQPAVFAGPSSIQQSTDTWITQPAEPFVQQATEPFINPAPQAEPIKPFQPETAAPQVKSASVSGGDEIIEMDRMRRLIADHMVMSKHTSPHVTSFVEADVTNLVLWREKVKVGFEKREGEKITFTPIFIEAVAKAIKDMPMINISVSGTQIIKKKDINISMATALPSGNLIVPVIKKADELNLVGLTKAVNDLASRARNNKLKPDDVQGGTFTITNVGSFGNVMGTPIINQPQVAILAVGAIKKKPAVIETPQGDLIGIRHMMFLSLSYDHRVVDGALGGSFVRRVADYLEAWDTDRKV